MSLNQSQYSIVESNSTVVGAILLSEEVSEDVVVEVIIIDGSANGNVEYTYLVM